MVSLTSDVVTETRSDGAQGPGLILAIRTVLDTVTNLREKISEKCIMERMRRRFEKIRCKFVVAILKCVCVG